MKAFIKRTLFYVFCFFWLFSFAPDPAPDLAFKTFQVKGKSYRLILVEGGYFLMGFAENEPAYQLKKYSQPLHTVYLDNYYLAETEVTQELWTAVMGNNPSHHGQCPLCPVENISWTDAQNFIKKLNELTSNRYKFCLPTDAQWEYAARGGKFCSAADPNNHINRGYLYAGSDQAAKVGWSSETLWQRNKKDGLKVSHQPVKGLKPNQLGFYDMSGNTAEWCYDFFDVNYFTQCEQAGVVCNPQGPKKGEYHVVRGGNWSNIIDDSRISVRKWTYDDAQFWVGMRLAAAAN